MATVGTATEAFVSWQQQLCDLHSELVLEADRQRSGGTDRLRVAGEARLAASDIHRDVAALRRWFGAADGFFARPTVTARCRRLGTAFRRLEIEYGSDAMHSLLRSGIADSMNGVRSAVDWFHARALTTLFMNALESDDEARDKDLWLLFVQASCAGILTNVYPQTDRWFHSAGLAFEFRDILAGFGPWGEHVVLAADLNRHFCDCAAYGEVNAFRVLVTEYVAEHAAASAFAHVRSKGDAMDSLMRRQLDQNFRSVLARTQDKETCRALLASGGARFCERTLEFGYGRERGLLPVGAWPAFYAYLESSGVREPVGNDDSDERDFFRDLLREFFPEDFSLRATAGQHYLDNGVGGLLGSVFGCQFILQGLFALDDDNNVFCEVRSRFLEVVRHRLGELSGPAREGRGVEWVEQVVSYIEDD